MKISLSFWFALAWILAILAGCNTVPVAMPREFATAAGQISTSLSDQGVLERFAAHLDGQAIEPGLETYAYVKYAAGSRIVGFSGQVGIRGEGAGSGGLTPAARAAIISEGAKYGITVEQAMQIIDRIQRGQSLPAPAPVPPAPAPSVGQLEPVFGPDPPRVAALERTRGFGGK